MTRMLMGVGNGSVAMALEGGYELMSLCASAESCMKALLGLEVLNYIIINDVISLASL